MDQSMNVSLIRRYYLLAPTVLMYNLWPDYIHTDYTYVLESKGWKFKQCAIICNFRIRDPMAGWTLEWWRGSDEQVPPRWRDWRPWSRCLRGRRNITCWREWKRSVTLHFSKKIILFTIKSIFWKYFACDISMKMYIDYCELRVVVVGNDWHRTNYFFYGRTLIMTKNLIKYFNFYLWIDWRQE